MSSTYIRAGGGECVCEKEGRYIERGRKRERGRERVIEREREKGKPRRLLSEKWRRICRLVPRT
jgi:hypothetical protein